MSRPGLGIACTVAWTELREALMKDGVLVGTQSGPATTLWIRGIAEAALGLPMPLRRLKPTPGYPKWFYVNPDAYTLGPFDSEDEMEQAIASDYPGR